MNIPQNKSSFTKMHRTYPTLLVMLVLGLVLTGCRTYGGFGSNEAIYNEIQRTNERFADDLARAQSELSSLQSRSSENPYVEALAVQYGSLVEAHEAILDEHHDMAQRLSSGSAYRSLSNTFRAVLAEQQLMRRQYQDVLRHAQAAFLADTTSVQERPYAVVPPYYARIAKDGSPLTVNDLLRQVQGGAPAQGSALPGPQGADPDVDGPVGDGSQESPSPSNGAPSGDAEEAGSQ